MRPMRVTRRKRRCAKRLILLPISALILLGGNAWAGRCEGRRVNLWRALRSSACRIRRLPMRSVGAARLEINVRVPERIAPDARTTLRVFFRNKGHSKAVLVFRVERFEFWPAVAGVSYQRWRSTAGFRTQTLGVSNEVISRDPTFVVSDRARPPFLLRVVVLPGGSAFAPVTWRAWRSDPSQTVGGRRSLAPGRYAVRIFTPLVSPPKLSMVSTTVTVARSRGTR